MARKILIYRLGSLGDTVVALPCFHLIRRRYPNAELRVLTNLPVSPSAPRLLDILDGSGLIDGGLEYPIGVRDLATLWKLRSVIRAWAPDTLIYIPGRSSDLKVLRDFMFFRVCGISTFFGLPFRGALKRPLKLGLNLWERESSRLARCLAALGDADIANPTNWDLALSKQEMAFASDIVNRKFGRSQFTVLSIGTKKIGYDWGDENWRKLVGELSSRDGGDFVFVGARTDRDRSEMLMGSCPERFLNLCGDLKVRETAAVLKNAQLYIGHDSGPMHLASAVGTPLVAIFSNLNQPGVWFPIGNNTRILYPQGINENILSISPDAVIGAANDLVPFPRATIEASESGNGHPVYKKFEPQ